MSSISATKPHVLILGAGIGGLTLAQALRKQGITAEVFERDTSINSRSQGWAIALHGSVYISIVVNMVAKSIKSAPRIRRIGARGSTTY
jgi:cation diffusion facilitator CzcD-associated flavoprotein CzcO